MVIVLFCCLFAGKKRVERERESSELFSFSRCVLWCLLFFLDFFSCVHFVFFLFFLVVDSPNKNTRNNNNTLDENDLDDEI